VVAVALLVGGILLLFIDRTASSPRACRGELPPGLRHRDLPMPGHGTGRIPQAATIIGGMTRKLTRKQAAEFSFLLAVPTMAAATATRAVGLLDDGGPCLRTAEHLDLLRRGQRRGLHHRPARHQGPSWASLPSTASRLWLVPHRRGRHAAGPPGLGCPAEHGMNEGLDPERGALLLVDKPVGWTSFNVVSKVRKTLRKLCGHRVKVGHAGTLDPLASGLLVSAPAAAPSQLPGLTGGQGYLGRAAPGRDHAQLRPRDRGGRGAALGTISGRPKSGHCWPASRAPRCSRPPNFSAKHVEGERAYHLARKGEPVDLVARARGHPPHWSCWAWTGPK
jgi:hypothetical protein